MKQHFPGSPFVRVSSLLFFALYGSFFFAVSTAWASGVTLTNSAGAACGSGTSCTISSFNATGGNLLLCSLFDNDKTQPIDSLTYAGQSMTQLDRSHITIGPGIDLYDYYIVNPAVGSNNVVLTDTLGSPTNYEIACDAFSGVNTSAPIDAHAANSQGVGTAASSTVTTTVANDQLWAVDGRSAGILSSPAGTWNQTVTEPSAPIPLGNYLESTVITSPSTITAAPNNGDNGGANWGALVAIAPIPPTTAPTVTTQGASAVTFNSATGNGNITSTGGANATARGVVYGTTLAYGATTTASGSFSTGAFTSSLAGLTCNTAYDIAAYATNSAGTGYGSNQTFTTSACPTGGGSFLPLGWTPTGGWPTLTLGGGITGPTETITTSTTTPPVATTTTYVTPATTTTTPTPTTPLFTRNLTLGMTGPDVEELQVFLNTHGDPLASTGPGSPGHEITRFGVLTKAALAKFQAAHSITPSVGYFGIKTRTYINGLIGT